MCPRGLGTDVLMMRVHWLDGWYRPLWSLRLCAVFIGQEPFPRASTWHHKHPTSRKAGEFTDGAGHLRGRTHFYAQPVLAAFFALKVVKIKGYQRRCFAVWRIWSRKWTSLGSCICEWRWAVHKNLFVAFERRALALPPVARWCWL